MYNYIRYPWKGVSKTSCVDNIHMEYLSSKDISKEVVHV